MEKVQLVLLDDMISSSKEFIKINYLDEFIKIKASREFEWIDGILGLSINYSEYTRNFIYQMWLQNLINFPKLAIFHTKRINNSRLLFGDFSQSSYTILRGYLNNINYCDESKENSEWGCNLSYLRIKHRKVFSQLKVQIDTSTQYTIFPEFLFENIIDYIIEEAKLNSREDCMINEYSRLICKCHNPNLFPDITLNIENRDLNLSLKDLYDFYSQDLFQCHFKILIQKKDLRDIANDSKNNIVLGTEAIKNSIFSFNFKEKKMGFAQFSDTEVNHIIDSIESQKKNNADIINISEGNIYKKTVSLIALFVIIVLFIGLYNCSNSLRFSSYFVKDEAESPNRKSLDYCELTDENYIYSNEKFKNNTHLRKVNSDFHSFNKEEKKQKINSIKDKNKSNDLSSKAYFKMESYKRLGRKESFDSEKNNPQVNLEMKNLLK